MTKIIRSMFAKKGANCKICKRRLKVGVRKICQVVCSIENGSPFSGKVHRHKGNIIKLSLCMQKWNYKKRKYKLPAVITCTVCGEKSKPRRKGQGRCLLPDTEENLGKMSPCQKTWKETAKGDTSGAKEDAEASRKFIAKHSNIDIKKRKCLRCGVYFESEGPFNRRCGTCTTAVNSGVTTIQRVDDDMDSGQGYGKHHALRG